MKHVPNNKNDSGTVEYLNFNLSRLMEFMGKQLTIIKIYFHVGMLNKVMNCQNRTFESKK